jgi:hypothetical protein
MRNLVLIPLFALGLTACAGLDIIPISPKDEESAHTQKKRKGYIVYQPMVVVEVTRKEICTEKDDKGTCKTSEIACSAGTPFTLPDPSKPFLIDVRSGLGKAGVDVSISNGWQLGNIKDNSDNTAVLGAIKEITGFRTSMKSSGPKEKTTCEAPGLYRVNLKEIKKKDSSSNTSELQYEYEIELKKLLVYSETGSG